MAAAIFVPLLEAWDSAKKALLPRKRRTARDGEDGGDERHHPNRSTRRRLSRRSGASAAGADKGGASRLQRERSSTPPESARPTDEGGDRRDSPPRRDRMADRTPRTQKRDSAFWPSPQPFSPGVSTPQRHVQTRRRDASERRHRSALDEYAYQRSVEHYGDHSRFSPFRAKHSPSELPFASAERGGPLFGRREENKSPQLAAQAGAGAAATGSASELERQFREEWSKLELENRALRLRISEIERRAARTPRVTHRRVKEPMAVREMLGEGANVALIRKKLERFHVKIPSLEEYRIRQQRRQEEILARENALRALRIAGEEQRERDELENAVAAPGDEVWPGTETERDNEGVAQRDEVEPPAKPKRGSQEGEPEIIDLIDSEEGEADEASAAHVDADGRTDGLTEHDVDSGELLLEDNDDADLKLGVSVVDETDHFSPLTTGAQNRVAWALSRTLPEDDVLVMHNNMTLTRRDMLRLSEHEWLNDEIINCYNAFLQERSDLAEAQQNATLPKCHFMSSFFYSRLVSMEGAEPRYDYASVRRWTKKVDVFTKDKLIVPINLQNVHWSCAVVDLRARQLDYLDSMGGMNSAVMEHLRRWLLDESVDKRQKKLDWEAENWTIKYPGSKVPQQTNGDDCGVFAAKFGDYVSRNAPLDFTSDDIAYFRTRMVAEILAKRTA